MKRHMRELGFVYDTGVKKEMTDRPNTEVTEMILVIILLIPVAVIAELLKLTK